MCFVAETVPVLQRWATIQLRQVLRPPEDRGRTKEETLPGEEVGKETIQRYVISVI